MPSITLKAPIKHGDEWLEVGAVLPDLNEKEAARLVRLGAAEMTRVAAPPPEDEDLGGLSPEEAAEIKQMKKADLVDALEKAAIDMTGTENTAQLRAMLMKAWALPGVDGGDE